MLEDFEKRYEIHFFSRLIGTLLTYAGLILFFLCAQHLTGEYFTTQEHHRLLLWSALSICYVNIFIQIVDYLIFDFCYGYYLENSETFTILECALCFFWVVAGTFLLNKVLSNFYETGLALRLSYLTLLFNLSWFYTVFCLFAAAEYYGKFYVERKEKKLDEIMQKALEDQNE